MYERTTDAIAETLRLFDEGELEQANRSAQKLVREHPEVYEVCLQMAKETAYRGLIGISRSFIDAAETLFPHEFLHLAISAEIELIVGTAELSVDLRSTVELRKQVLPLIYSAEHLLSNRQLTEALQNYERAAEVDSNNTRIWQKVGALCYSLGRYPDSIIAWLKAHRLASMAPLPLIGMAKSLFASGNESGAVQAYRQGLMRAARSCPLALYRVSACEPKKFCYEWIDGWCNGTRGTFQEIEAESVVDVRNIPVLDEMHLPGDFLLHRASKTYVRHLCSVSFVMSDIEIPSPIRGDQHPNRQIQEFAPRLWMAELNDVDVVGAEAVLLSDGVHLVCESSFHPRCNQDGAIAHTGMATSRETVLMLPKGRVSKIESAVLFGGRSCGNYFHWITQYLPRIAMLRHDRKYDHFPMLLPEDLPRQIDESLDALDIKGRERMILRRDSWLKVSNLLVLSSSAHLSDDRSDRQSRLMVHPWAVRILRELMSIPNRQRSNAGRRVFMRRFTKVDSRRLVNEEEIATIFEGHGVESIDTRQMSFLEQVKLFSECEIVIGTAGAAFANLMFTPEGCRSLCLASRSAGYPYVFDSIARVSDQYFACLWGEPIRDQHSSEGAHYSFWIEPAFAEKAIAAFFSRP